ncbi:hypothetical protein DEO72_LG9g1925 [Vigna unguiculata]|uniref:Uncharacterized protein n=1 Tax=Vigna unguiculata TaxID=3917 RepID=A0A4D6N232_VIGUN|nr:hypothetical protein DEO72_LG9g1925 [Vigna unguiculata]
MKASTTSGAWLQGGFHQAEDPRTVGLLGVWRLTARKFRPTVYTGFTWRRLGCARR